ncbi:MAG: tetratricopeptide repeat protein [Alphaproteobacteria bacterium]|jgi:predicted Zn-dependent protease
MQKFPNLLAVGMIATGLAFGATGAMAMGSDSGNKMPAKQKSSYAVAVEKVKARDYRAAIPLLRDVVSKEPRNTDALNYLGFSYRETGDLKNALTYYQRALAVDPNHKGANEYLGELYVRLGDLPKAEAQLVKLDKLCAFGCAEYEELKRKVAALRRRRGS